MPSPDPARISSISNHLCSMPGLAHAMLTTREYRALLTVTGGDVMVNGRLYDVMGVARGAGMYTVRLQRRSTVDAK